MRPRLIVFIKICNKPKVFYIFINIFIDIQRTYLAVKASSETILFREIYWKNSQKTVFIFFIIIILYHYILYIIIREPFNRILIPFKGHLGTQFILLNLFDSLSLFDENSTSLTAGSLAPLGRFVLAENWNFCCKFSMI